MATTPTSLADRIQAYEEYARSADYISSRWLPVVLQRISASILPEGYSLPSDGTWIDARVASAGRKFLYQIAAAFPKDEPYLSVSPSGALVVEFRERSSKITFAITPDLATSYFPKGADFVSVSLPLDEWTVNRVKGLRRAEASE
jgi:hypothetical protein